MDLGIGLGFHSAIFSSWGMPGVMLVTPLRLRLRFVTSVIDQFTRDFGLDRQEETMALFLHCIVY